MKKSTILAVILLILIAAIIVTSMASEMLDVGRFMSAPKKRKKLSYVSESLKDNFVVAHSIRFVDKREFNYTRLTSTKEHATIMQAFRDAEDILSNHLDEGTDFEGTNVPSIQILAINYWFENYTVQQDPYRYFRKDNSVAIRQWVVESKFLKFLAIRMLLLTRDSVPFNSKLSKEVFSNARAISNLSVFLDVMERRIQMIAKLLKKSSISLVLSI